VITQHFNERKQHCKVKFSQAETYFMYVSGTPKNVKCWPIVTLLKVNGSLHKNSNVKVQCIGATIYMKSSTCDWQMFNCVCAGCDQPTPLGMITGKIADWQITASSVYPVQWDRHCAERYARVYQPDRRGWCAKYKSASEWIQVDLGVASKVPLSLNSSHYNLIVCVCVFVWRTSRDVVWCYHEDTHTQTSASRCAFSRSSALDCARTATDLQVSRISYFVVNIFDDRSPKTEIAILWAQTSLVIIRKPSCCEGKRACYLVAWRVWRPLAKKSTAINDEWPRIEVENRQFRSLYVFWL